MIANKSFKIARILKGLTQYDVSQMTSPRISPARLSLFERGYIELRDDERETLAAILGIINDQVMER